MAGVDKDGETPEHKPEGWRMACSAVTSLDVCKYIFGASDKLLPTFEHTVHALQFLLSQKFWLTLN